MQVTFPSGGKAKDTRGIPVCFCENQTTLLLTQFNFVFRSYICIQMLTELSKFLEFVVHFVTQQIKLYWLN